MHGHTPPDRRRFLTQLAVGAALGANSSPAAAGAAGAGTLPTIKLGKSDVTRLIAGDNPIGGYSHTTPKLDRLIREWVTPERTLDYVRRCEQNGINTWQSSVDPKCFGVLRKAWDAGSKIQWICLMRDVDPAQWKEIVELKPVAVVHHG